jgi:subtilisin family serine protease
MHRPTSLLLLLLATVALGAPRPQMDPGQVIVRLDEVLDSGLAAAAVDGPLWSLARPLVPRLGIHLVKLHGIEVEEALVGLQALPAVRWAQPDHLLSWRETLPDDPSFPSQWSLQNLGTEADIRATLAWDLGTGGLDPDGDEIVIAVVDGGMELGHPDLAPNLWINAAEAGGLPGVDDDANGYVDDLHGWDGYNNDGSIPGNGHGTHVAGIAGARGNNGNQVCGVNWDVKLMAVAASSPQTSIVAVGYGYVLEQKSLWLESGGQLGANVVVTNSSFGVDFADCEAPNYELWNDLYDAMGEVGILSAAATMNRNANVDLQGDVPTGCSSEWMVAVTNTTNQDQRNSGAAYGATTIDLGAPGTSVLSTYTGGGTATLSGTSMATPHVAGAIALLHSVLSPDLNEWLNRDPAAAALELKRLLLDSVDPLPALEGITVSGGRLNLHAATLTAAAWTPPSPVVELQLELGIPWGASLSWQAVAGALHYHVERAPSGFGPWTRIASLEGTTWSDPDPVAWSGTARFYRVIAVLPEN